MAGKLDVIKMSPLLRTKILGYPKICGEEKWDIPKFMRSEKMGYPKICAVGFGAQSNKKCDRFWTGTAGSGISQNVSPP